MKIISLGLVLGLVRSDLSSEEIKQAINRVLTFNNTITNEKDVKDNKIKEKDVKDIKIKEKDILHYKVPLESIQSNQQPPLELIKQLNYIPITRPPPSSWKKNHSKPILLVEEIKESNSPQFYFHKAFYYDKKKIYFDFDLNYATVLVNLSGGFVYENYVHIYMAQYKIEGILINKPGILYKCHLVRIYRRYPGLNEPTPGAINGFYSNRCKDGCYKDPFARADAETFKCCCPYKLNDAREQTLKEKEHSSNILAEFGKRRLREPLLKAIKNDFPSLFKDENNEDDEEE